MIQIDFTIKPKETIHEYRLDYWGNRCTYDKNGLHHSYDDLPAIVYSFGTKCWLEHGNYHRDNDLPAIVWADGRKEYWLNGKRIK